MHVEGKVALPVELWQEIIDLIQDRRTLQACILTCKAWMHIGRPHLHGHISLRSERQAKRLITALSASPDVGHYILDLELNDARRATTEAPWLDKSLPLFLRYLPNVRTLHLVDVNHDQLSRRTAMLFDSGFLQLEELKLQRVRFESSRSMNTFIASFRSVLALQFLNVHILSVQSTLRSTPIPILPPHINTVDVDHLLAFIHTIDWMTHSSPPPRITNLTLPIPTTISDFPILGDFLKACRFLERFCVQCQYPSVSGYSMISEAIQEHLDLSWNKSLRYLHFEMLCILNIPNMTLSWLPTLLRQLDSSVLEEVHISIVFKASVVNLELFPWREVEEALMISSTTVSTWSFLVVWALQKEAFEFTRHKLPTLASKGMLRFRQY